MSPPTKGDLDARHDSHSNPNGNTHSPSSNDLQNTPLDAYPFPQVPPDTTTNHNHHDINPATTIATKPYEELEVHIHQAPSLRHRKVRTWLSHRFAMLHKLPCLRSKPSIPVTPESPGPTPRAVIPSPLISAKASPPESPLRERGRARARARARARKSRPITIYDDGRGDWRDYAYLYTGEIYFSKSQLGLESRRQSVVVGDLEDSPIHDSAPVEQAADELSAGHANVEESHSPEIEVDGEDATVERDVGE
ncbi:hypothetical protein AUEXF2481DRAFT_401312 [Aureobasidium subglaciale EXF-2481]|uniref:Uncharacterized protein n=1 Tax=Aureobasidium subglaciale (strain EXF-2481) TaxID=1043005 RepID=A0A074YN93_AURSE|nr:uncharacterized protein AUEXF2481DRAFT_401312 [Aureobasidium subglaciale EXF-2481]KEQ99130.1 hypothetical protein AUEXF2481DRAFT_401312 [Aureobasidium subglaciale EXF-2481]